MSQDRTHMELTSTIMSLDSILQDVDNPNIVIEQVSYVRTRLHWLRRELPSFYKEVENGHATEADDSTTTPTGEGA